MNISTVHECLLETHKQMHFLHHLQKKIINFYFIFLFVWSSFIMYGGDEHSSTKA